MENEKNGDEIIIDFRRVFEILNYRKNLILKTFLVSILFFTVLTFILPKKYETSAELYVNKSNATNLVELNPYMISSLSGEGMSGLLSGANNALQNEIEIIKSPLVMDGVIKENDLRYKSGKKKGEFISTESFLKKNLSIENKKGTNIISIEYKSRNPLQTYNVINSIIANYKKVNEEINTKKATKDKAILEGSYADTNKVLNNKLAALKHSNALPDSAVSGLGMLAALKGHSKAIGGAMGSIQNQVVEGQKSQISVEQEVDKLKLVKSKLEWTKLVEQMARDTTNVIVLKSPELKRNFEQTSPKLFPNLISGLIFGIFAAIIIVILAEIIDKKLTYSALGENVMYNIDKNIDELKLILMTNSRENFSFIIFDGFKIDLFKSLEGFNNFKVIKADITPKTIDEISNSDKLIFAQRIGQTPKKLYTQLKTTCEEMKKTVYKELI